MNWQDENRARVHHSVTGHLIHSRNGVIVKGCSLCHRAEPTTDERGALVCARCGNAVRQWPDGRFPIHASA